MRTLTLSTLAAACLLSTSVFASSPLSGCSDADSDLAKVFYDRIEASYTQGNTSLLELKSAETAYLDVQVCAGKIDSAAFCARKEAAIQKMLEIYKAGGSIGSQSADSPFAALKQLAALRTSCQ
jgi:hypothetical protein